MIRLSHVQDHYTAMQPGLQRMVLRLEELVQRIDGERSRLVQYEGMCFYRSDLPAQVRLFSPLRIPYTWCLSEPKCSFVRLPEVLVWIIVGIVVACT